MIVETLNSTYEIDMDQYRVRRLEGKNPAHGYMFGRDGEWMEAKNIVRVGGTPAKPNHFIFTWDEFGQSTITSLVKKVKRDA